MNRGALMASSLPQGMEGFHDIEGPVLLDWPWFWILLGLVILLSLILVLGRLLKSRPERPRQKAAPPPIPPLEVALGELEALRRHALDLEADPFTVKVSDTVRTYLEAALSIPAREQTSEEFLRLLQERRDLPAPLRHYMPAFLEQSDRVKFAAQNLEAEGRSGLLDNAEAVVRETDTALKTTPQTEEAQT
jgi:hypothetical protein